MMNEKIDKLFEIIEELSKYSREEVEEQLDEANRRLNEIKEKMNTRPKILKLPNLKHLINACEDHINSIKEQGRANKNDENYIYEEALKAIYGEDIFDWINKYDKGF